MSRGEQKWKKFVTSEEHSQLAEVIRLEEEIVAMTNKLRALKEERKRKPIIARCNLRAWRASQR